MNNFFAHKARILSQHYVSNAGELRDQCIGQSSKSRSPAVARAAGNAGEAQGSAATAAEKATQK